MTKYTPAQIKKAIVAAVALALTVLCGLLDASLLPEAYVPWVQVFIAVCGSYGVFRARNAPPSQDH